MAEPNLEQCCYGTCSVAVPAKSRCGGVLFGTRDDPGYGCGRIFCDNHLIGRAGPYYCTKCWERRKAAYKVNNTL